MLDRFAANYPAEVLRDVQEVLMLPQPRHRHEAFLPVDVMALNDPSLRKLNQAGEALRRSRVPLKAISERFGYSSEASLHRVFKTATGLTPTAFRQTYSEVAPAIDQSGSRE